jgi:hypothetical protein
MNYVYQTHPELAEVSPKGYVLSPLDQKMDWVNQSTGTGNPLL